MKRMFVSLAVILVFFVTNIAYGVDTQREIEGVLSEMTEAYTHRDLTGFMKHISEDFVGDLSSIEDAVERDFKSYNNLNLEMTITKVTESPDGTIKVDFAFNWFGMTTRGKIVNPVRSNTTYTFRKEGEKYVLLAMKKPIIFGVKMASLIDTEDYFTTEKDTAEAVFGEEDASHAVPIRTAILNSAGPLGQSIKFTDGTVTGGSAFDLWAGPATLNPVRGAAQALLGSGILEDFFTAQMVNLGGALAYPGTTSVYSLKTGDGFYVLYEVPGGAGGTTFTIRYKYQRDGTNKLPNLY